MRGGKVQFIQHFTVYSSTVAALRWDLADGVIILPAVLRLEVEAFTTQNLEV